MTLHVEHELHKRRKGRNYGLGLILAGFIAVIFGLTVVKVLELGNANQFERFDHVARPQLIPEEGAGE
ncbi:cytochrome C oxidase assembly protein [Loktanella sp. 1ANDIMAR09]|uniref:Cytochrome C oxidase assembly protein n=1 Tax=Yoonia rosea TaxID=287098 RepID=A0A1R3XJ81_9RHOB|nr:hypothetical protein [Yoonia rosea]KQB95833.1 cytochrome C oxidase assembly protein [Loktanella sp. 1ANDIMAR09]SIT91671.1 hypothetical protein SAMN05421665_3441 [Yoonia rosea]